MNPPEKKIIVTYHTTSAAVAMEKACREHLFSGRLIPIPASISAGCGLAWAGDASQKAQILSMIENDNMEIDKWYEMMI